MSIQELKEKVADAKAKLATSADRIIKSSPKGPVDITLIEAIVEALEEQETRIKALEKNQGNF